MPRAIFYFAATLIAFVCHGCAVPQFDVPTDSAGQPTVATIISRIQCEIRDMVRDDMGEADITSFHRKFLLNGDYDVEIVLSLETNNTGGLAPNLAWINPLSKITSFMFGGTATLSESRDHNFTENIQLSVRNIYTEWKLHANNHDCPVADTNLAGTLGISSYVAIAALTPNLDAKQTLSGKGVFGGSDQFLVTKAINSIGPTWSLVHFKGPGPLGSLSQVNTDKITLAFAQGPNAGNPLPPLTAVIPANPPNPSANFFLQQLLTSQILTQIFMLQNNPP
jgi:hypothetical protein